MRSFLMFTIIAGAMLFFCPLLADPYMTPKLVIAFGACVPLLLMKSNRESSLEMQVNFLLAAVFISVLAAWDCSYALVGTRLQTYDSAMGYFCYALVLFSAVRSEVSPGRIAWWVTYLSFPVSAYSIFQRFFDDPLLIAALQTNGRTISTQGGPVFLGSMMAVIIVCIFYSLLQSRRKGFAASALVLAAAGLYCSGTRGGMLAAAVGCAAMLPRKYWKWFLVTGAAGVLATARVYSPVADLNRLEVWGIAWRAFTESPILGIGPGNYLLAFRGYVTDEFVFNAGYMRSSQSHAHNDILAALSSLGVIGLAAYIAVGVACVFAIKKADARVRPLLLGLFAAYFIFSKFNPVAMGPMIVLAAIFGAASAETTKRPTIRPVFAAVGIFFFALASQISTADFFYAKAVKTVRNDLQAAIDSAFYFERASRFNPYEIQFLARRVDSIGGLLNAAKPENRGAIGKTMVELAKQGLRRHPNDSFAHELYGKAIVVSAMLGNGDNIRHAVIAFENAQRLAPTFTPIMRRRIALAKALKNKAIENLATESLVRISTLEKKGRKKNAS